MTMKHGLNTGTQATPESTSAQSDMPLDSTTGSPAAQTFCMLKGIDGEPEHSPACR